MKKSFFLIGVFFVFYKAGATDFSTIVKSVLDNDASFLAAKMSFEAAKEKVPIAKAALLPKINLNINTNKQAGESSFNGGAYVSGQPKSFGWALQLNQAIFHTENILGLQQADVQVKIAALNFENAKQELIYRTAQNYFDVALAQDNIGVLQAHLKAVTEQLVLTKRNFDAGIGTVTDIHESKARFEMVRAQSISARNDLESKRAELEKSIGETPRFFYPLKKNIQLPRPVPENVEDWISAALKGGLQQSVKLLEVELAEKEVLKIEAAHRPTMDLNFNYGRNDSSGSLSSPANISTRTNSASIGLQVNVPIYAGGGVSARVSEAEKLLKKSNYDFEYAKKTSSTLTKQAYAGVANGHLQIEALVAAVEASRYAVEANKVGYRVGTKINNDVLNAEQLYAAAQRDLLKAKHETLMQSLKLKLLAGILDFSDVMSINELLDADYKIKN